jgi:hypothetical protein
MKKKSPVLYRSGRGGAGQENHFIELDQHHPICAMNGAARHFLDRAATPPLLRRGLSLASQFTLTHIDRAYNRFPNTR